MHLHQIRLHDENVVVFIRFLATEEAYRSGIQLVCCQKMTLGMHLRRKLLP